ncbi:MAG: hypothetical protein AAB388_01415 [Patescibacteria group bacterium]
MRGSEALAFDKEAHEKTSVPTVQAYAIPLDPKKHEILGPIQSAYTKCLMVLCAQIAKDAAFDATNLRGEKNAIRQWVLREQLKNSACLLEFYTDKLESEIKEEFPALTNERFLGFDILGDWRVAGIKRHPVLTLPFAANA